MSDLPEDRLKILLPKYLEDKLTTEERLELSDLAMKFPQAWEMLAKMRSTGQIPIEFQERQHAAMKRGLHKIEATIRQRERFLHLRKNGIKWMIYGTAAAIGGVILFTPSLRNSKQVTTASTPVAPSAVINEIVPGGNKATLTLADGRTIRLDSLKDGKLPEQEGVSAVLQDSGTIAYTAGNATTTAYNILTIPRGGQYRVILPDGTKVWLNNVSSLRYPIAFTGKTREVAVTGEAYFEVAKDVDKPFRVKVNDVNVLVLGTAFNISAYTTRNTRAVLLKGSVRITGIHNSCLLKPGQALATSGVNKWKALPEEHAGESIAWTRGVFDFRGVPLSEVLESLGRSYNVEVDLRGMKNDPPCQLRGVSRHTPLPLVLKMLLDPGQFRLEGGKLIVTTA